MSTSDEQEQPTLTREGTMQVTAKEGEAFLESKGMKVTNDVAKTRAQKEKLDEISTPSQEDKPPRMPREGTMAVTAKEGKELLGDDSYEKTRQQTAVSKEEESADGNTTQPPRIPRDNTMEVTAVEGRQLLDGEKLEKTRAQTASSKEEPTPPKAKRATTIAQTTEESSYILGDEERGKTRSETRKSLSEEEKPAVKRANTMEQTAKEGAEFLARDAKRPKLDGENGTAQGETKAES